MKTIKLLAICLLLSAFMLALCYAVSFAIASGIYTAKFNFEMAIDKHTAEYFAIEGDTSHDEKIIRGGK